MSTTDWEPGRRDVVGLFKPADFAGSIFEVEYSDDDLDRFLGLLAQHPDDDWAQALSTQVKTARRRYAPTLHLPGDDDG